MAITITRTDWDDAAGAELRRAQRAELDSRYGSDDHEPGTPPSADDIAVFLVAFDADGSPVGCGALRRLDDATAEIKRMFVAPASRGTGVSSAVLRALEDEARAMGVTELRLETGTEQPDAIRFYEREGYSPIPNFGPYVGSAISLCYARTL
ncbi:GNAT family N-acetyltransferase [Plantibacter sp. Mn2098]|uniref:GNAT family N-acetyltransferase n=1 Tax=Plantibacter sp. Mn2098 TaxID=3395266 RepID=UPI003BE2937C